MGGRARGERVISVAHVGGDLSAPNAESFPLPLALLEHEPKPGEGWPPELMAYIDAQLETGEYPQISSMFSADRAETWVRLAEATLDPFRFERGLERLLDGIEHALRQQGALPAGG